MSAAPLRCAEAARGRGDAVLATAPPARRWVLLETPGPWGAQVWPSAGLDDATAAALARAAARIRARVLLIRRPGRHPVHDGPRLLAVVDRDAGVHWQTWDTRSAVDLAAALDSCADRDSTGAHRPLALVCTQGRHDVCCAVEGRPVVAALDDDPRVEAWECSHLGGDRFAANLLWLPSGQLFGGLDADSVGPALDAALNGRVLLPHYRGRYGDPIPEQAARWFLMQHVETDRPGDVHVESYAGPDQAGPALSLLASHAGTRYRVRFSWRAGPARRLTCRAVRDAWAREYTLLDVSVA